MTPMNKTLLILGLAAALTLTACARGDTTAAVGKHNLSKGDCRGIRADGRAYRGEMTHKATAKWSAVPSPRATAAKSSGSERRAAKRDKTWAHDIKLTQ